MMQTRALKYGDYYKNPNTYSLLEGGKKDNKPRREPTPHEVFFSEAVGAIDLIKSIDASIKGEPDKIEAIKKKYLTDLKSSIEGKDYDLKSMKEIWDSILNLAKNSLDEVKKSTKVNTDNNPELIQIKKEIQDLKDKKEKGEMEQNEYAEEMNLLRSKAIAQVKSSEIASFFEYAKACGLLYNAVGKFKEGALLEIKESSKEELQKEYDHILELVITKTGEEVKTTKERAGDKVKKEKDYYERKEKRDQEKLKGYVKSYDAGATGGTGGSKPSKIKEK
jgi:hypothetical protein